MSSPYVETGQARLVSQWCYYVEDNVTLKVQGSIFGDLIRGTVTACLKHKCPHKNKQYCWVGKTIQTKL